MFSVLVKKYLKQIFIKHHLQIVEEHDEYIKFRSDFMVVVLAHNFKEKANYFYIGRNEDNLILVDNAIIKKVFNADIQVDLLPIETFLKNICFFFENAGQKLLIGDEKTFIELEKFINRRSKNYTTRLLEEQVFLQADDAWQRKDYRSFVELIEKTDSTKWPASYIMKYKLATKK